MNAAAGEELRVDRAVRRASVVDAEGYKNSVRGVDIDAIRVGASDAPNHVASVADDHLIVTAGHIGFPISHTAHIPDATTIVARVHSAPAGSRWAGVDRPGTCFTFVTTDIERVEQRAAQLRSSIHRLKPGSVRDVTAIADFSAASSRLDPLEALRDGAFLPGNLLRVRRTDSGRCQRRCPRDRLRSFRAIRSLLQDGVRGVPVRHVWGPLTERAAQRCSRQAWAHWQGARTRRLASRPDFPPNLASGPSWMHLWCRCRRGPIARTLASHADRVLGNARQDDRTASDLHGQRDAAQEDQSSGG